MRKKRQRVELSGVWTLSPSSSTELERIIHSLTGIQLEDTWWRQRSVSGKVERKDRGWLSQLESWSRKLMEGSVLRLLHHRKLCIFACLLFVLWFVSFSFLIVYICEPCVLSGTTDKQDWLWIPLWCLTDLFSNGRYSCFEKQINDN